MKERCVSNGKLRIDDLCIKVLCQLLLESDFFLDTKLESRGQECAALTPQPPPWGLICSVGSGNRRNNDGEQIKD